MNRFSFLQLLNIVGITNLLVIISFKDVVVSRVFLFGVAFSGGLILVTISLLIVFSYRIRRDFDPAFSPISSDFSVILKYILPNFMVSGLLLLLVLSLYHDLRLLRVFFVFAALTIYPLSLYRKAQFVLTKESEIKAYNFTRQPSEIRIDKIEALRKVLFGFLYKIIYIDTSNIRKTIYFFPRSGLFPFLSTPTSIKELRIRLRQT